MSCAIRYEFVPSRWSQSLLFQTAALLKEAHSAINWLARGFMCRAQGNVMTAALWHGRDRREPVWLPRHTAGLHLQTADVGTNGRLSRGRWRCTRRPDAADRGRALSRGTRVSGSGLRARRKAKVARLVSKPKRVTNTEPPTERNRTCESSS